MYIVLDTNNDIEQLRTKYLVLELDTLIINDEPVTSYAIIDSEHVTLNEVARIKELGDLHGNLIKNYKLKNWNYCEDALNHLYGIFKGELDSFYDTLGKRITELKTQDLDDQWTGSITVEK